MTPYARLHLGTAPDSWGIWFPDDPKQPHWSTFLDEVVESGFRTIELGPFGYLPTHRGQLKDETRKARADPAGRHGRHCDASRRRGIRGEPTRRLRGVRTARRDGGAPPRGAAGDVHRPAHGCAHPAGGTDR